MAMLGAPCSACCGPCVCPSWCSYKMVFSSPKTCAATYPNYSGTFPCPSDAPATVESPYTCNTNTQTTSTAVKGVLSYKFGSTWLWPQNPDFVVNDGLVSVEAPNDTWSVTYPSLRGMFSGGLGWYYDSNVSAFDYTKFASGYSAEVRPFCSASGAQPVLGVELIYRASETQSRCTILTGPTRVVCTVRQSILRTKTKTVYFSADCVSDSLKWCPGVSQNKFAKFPNPFSGWLDFATTSYGTYDSSVDTIVSVPGGGSLGSKLPGSSVLPTVHFDIQQRESCDDGNPLP